MNYYASLTNTNPKTTVVGGKAIKSGKTVKVTLKEFIKMSTKGSTNVPGVVVNFLMPFNAEQLPFNNPSLGEIIPVDGVYAQIKHDPGVDGNDGVTFISNLAGVVGNDISITIVDPAAEGVAKVAVNGLDIVITLANSNVPAITSTAKSIETLVNADPVAKVLVTAVAEGTGAGLFSAKVKTKLAGGVDVAPVAAVGSFGFNAAGTFMYVLVDEVTWKKVAIAAL